MHWHANWPRVGEMASGPYTYKEALKEENLSPTHPVLRRADQLPSNPNHPPLLFDLKTCIRRVLNGDGIPRRKPRELTHVSLEHHGPRSTSCNLAEG